MDASAFRMPAEIFSNCLEATRAAAAVVQRPRLRIFQPTTQPTIRVVLYDLRCVWQSPRVF